MIFGWLETLVSEILIESRMDSLYLQNPLSLEISEVRENDIAFMNLLNEKGIIQNEGGKDESGSHARKWRLMFSKNGLIYPKLDKKYGEQAALGKMDDITPFGRVFFESGHLSCCSRVLFEGNERRTSFLWLANLRIFRH